MISVVVVNWNGKTLLPDCLQSLRSQTFPDVEILVVDNGSTDGSADWVRQNFPEFRLVQLNENRGFAGGNNAGIIQARGEWIALLNNDAAAAPAWPDSSASTSPMPSFFIACTARSAAFRITTSSMASATWSICTSKICPAVCFGDICRSIC